MVSPGWPYVLEAEQDCVGSPPEGWCLAPPPVQVKARARRGELRLRGQLTPTVWGSPTGLSVAIAEAPGYWRFEPVALPEGGDADRGRTAVASRDAQVFSQTTTSSEVPCAELGIRHTSR